MWRVSYSLYGLSYTSNTYSSLQECINELHRLWRDFNFDAMEWFKIEEKYDGLWYLHSFYKNEWNNSFFLNFMLIRVNVSSNLQTFNYIMLTS